MGSTKHSTINLYNFDDKRDYGAYDRKLNLQNKYLVKNSLIIRVLHTGPALYDFDGGFYLQQLIGCFGCHRF